MAERERSDGVVTEECLQELLDFFMKSVYKARTVDRRVSSLWEFGMARLWCDMNTGYVLS